MKTKMSKKLTVLQGTNRSNQKDKLDIPKIDIPEMIDFDKGGVDDFYDDLCKHLNDHNALVEVDKYLLAMVVDSYERFIKFRGQDEIQTYSTGAKAMSTEYQIFKAERDFIMKSFSQLGIGQPSREKILAFVNSLEKPEKESLIAQLLKES